MNSKITLASLKETEILSHFSSVESFESFFGVTLDKSSKGEYQQFKVNGVKSEKEFLVQDYEFSFLSDDSVFVLGTPFVTNPKIKKKQKS